MASPFITAMRSQLRKLQRRQPEPQQASVAELLLPLVTSYYIQGERGFYIECGAHDGTTYSNTWRLERAGWRGMLIEPSSNALDLCRARRRPDNIFVNCALVADPSITSVTGDFNGSPMSSIGGERLGKAASVTVPARTLQSLLDEHHVAHVDFFSLDVEGNEMAVLKGLDLNRNPPTMLLIEVYETDRAAMTEMLMSKGYGAPINVTNFSRATHPRWDGTHNDYFFVHDSAQTR